MFVATLTPLNQDDSINISVLSHHTQTLLKKGFDGILLFGTTGEGPSFSSTERKHALEALIQSGISPKNILVSAGCNALLETVDLVKHAHAQRVEGVLVMPPTFFKHVQDEGIFTYYQTLIQQAAAPGLQLYIYHFPEMNASVSISVVRQLKQAFPDIIVGVKDSGGNFEHTAALLELKKEFAHAFPGKLFKVFVGSELDITRSVAEGGDGTISGLANIAPDEILSLRKDTQQLAAIKIWREKLAALGPSRIAGIKALKAEMDPMWNNRMKAPLHAVKRAAQK